MQIKTRRNLTYVVGDKLFVKNPSEFLIFIDGNYGNWIDDGSGDPGWEVSYAYHKFKNGKVSYTYMIGRPFYVSMGRILTEEEMNKYFICRRVIAIKRNKLLSILS